MNNWDNKVARGGSVGSGPPSRPPTPPGAEGAIPEGGAVLAVVQDSFQDSTQPSVLGEGVRGSPPSSLASTQDITQDSPGRTDTPPGQEGGLPPFPYSSPRAAGRGEERLRGDTPDGIEAEEEERRYRLREYEEDDRDEIGGDRDLHPRGVWGAVPTCGEWDVWVQGNRAGSGLIEDARPGAQDGLRVTEVDPQGGLLGVLRAPVPGMLIRVVDWTPTN